MQGGKKQKTHRHIRCKGMQIRRQEDTTAQRNVDAYKTKARRHVSTKGT